VTLKKREPERRLGLTTAVPQAIVAACRGLAARSRAQGSSRPLYCLRLIPKADSYRIDAAGGLNGYRNVAESTVVSVRSGLSGHWTFAEGEPGAVIGSYLPAERARSVTRTRLGGRKVTIYRLPAGSSFYSGHVVIEWRQRKTAFQVSMHGHRNLKRAELMSRALMREIELCSPEAPRSRNGACRLVF